MPPVHRPWPAARASQAVAPRLESAMPGLGLGFSGQAILPRPGALRCCEHGEQAGRLCATLTPQVTEP